MEYILIISLFRYFKNTATFKLSHKASDIAWNVTKYHEARNNVWQKRVC
jgi:glutathione peroxidase-family protein